MKMKRTWTTAELITRIIADRAKKAKELANSKANKWPPGERGTQPHYDAIKNRWGGRSLKQS